MAATHGKPLYLYLLDGWGYAFVPQQANRVLSLVDIVRQDYYTVRLQVVSTTDFTLGSDLTAPAAAVVPINSYSTILFGLKTQALYDAGGDYSVAWTGFNTGDTDWHSLASGRASIDIATTTALAIAQYRAGVELSDGTYGVRYPDLPLFVNLRRELIVGTEPTSPSGTVFNSGSATIPAGSDRTNPVSCTGMTTAGYVIPFWLGAAQGTLGATAMTNTFTITNSGPVAADTLVGYYIVKKV